MSVFVLSSLKTYILYFLQSHSTGLVPDHDEGLLMFATLDGSLIAVDQKTGNIQWQQNDGKFLKNIYQLR